MYLLSMYFGLAGILIKALSSLSIYYTSESVYTEPLNPKPCKPYVLHLLKHLVPGTQRLKFRIFSAKTPSLISTSQILFIKALSIGSIIRETP